ncbi:MAG TPA: hypothetical protein VGH19_06105 [Verrucomicrobiae bacterium]
MFAGPNGSGKSTLKSYLPQNLLGVYLNPDEIEQEIRRQGCLDFASYSVSANEREIRTFFASSKFLQDEGFGGISDKLVLVGSRLDFSEVEINSYLASVTVDFIRQKLLAHQISFTFETVMSHPGKIDILIQAQALGYRTYLYFVATDDPAINVSRVRNRVALNGHNVPEDKIVLRYARSLDLLMDAIRYTNRAYVFDNSGDSKEGTQTWLAEITDGKKLELKTGGMPAWFRRSVLDKIV